MDWNNCIVQINNIMIKNNEGLNLKMDLPIYRTFVYEKTLDCALQLENNSLLVQTIQQNDRNNEIKIPASKNYNYWNYSSLDWMLTVLEMNKVTRNIQFTMMYSPPKMLQTNCIHQTVFWSLSLTFFLWSEVKWLNYILLVFLLMFYNPCPKIRR